MLENGALMTILCTGLKVRSTQLPTPWHYLRWPVHDDVSGGFFKCARVHEGGFKDALKIALSDGSL